MGQTILGTHIHITYVVIHIRAYRIYLYIQICNLEGFCILQRVGYKGLIIYCSHHLYRAGCRRRTTLGLLEHFCVPLFPKGPLAPLLAKGIADDHATNKKWRPFLWHNRWPPSYVTEKAPAIDFIITSATLGNPGLCQCILLPYLPRV